MSRLLLAVRMVAVATLGLVTGCGGSADNAPRAGVTIFAQAEDLRPSATLTDWVSFADYVVAVRVTSEKLAPARPDDLKRGEGTRTRRVTMKVQDVLWSSPDAERSAPDEFGWDAWGSDFRDGDVESLRPIAAHGTPRFERGHEYILAIFWTPERCAEGDREGAGWQGLGSGAMIPFDGGVLGAGEIEGRTVGPRTSPDWLVPAETPARAAAVKGTAGDLAGKLRATSPLPVQQRKAFDPSPAPCPAGS